MSLLVKNEKQKNITLYEHPQNIIDKSKKQNTSNTQIHDHPFSWYDTDTSMK